jgi:hypothetical protein
MTRVTQPSERGPRLRNTFSPWEDVATEPRQLFEYDQLRLHELVELGIHPIQCERHLVGRICSQSPAARPEKGNSAKVEGDGHLGVFIATDQQAEETLRPSLVRNQKCGVAASRSDITFTALTDNGSRTCARHSALALDTGCSSARYCLRVRRSIRANVIG